MVMELSLTVDPHDCVLAIVGSRDIPQYVAESLIRQSVLGHKPRMVISGGARGIDRYAVEIAREMGIATMEFLPSQQTWDAPEVGESTETFDGTDLRITVPGGYKQRNLRIAEACTCLVRIYSPTTKTYGSGFTADRAEELGKPVVRHLIGAT